jgi:hypothetical protein
MPWIKTRKIAAKFAMIDAWRSRFSMAAFTKLSRTRALRAMSRVQFSNFWDWLAEQGEFELPVPISEQPDDNHDVGSETKCRDCPRLNAWSSYTVGNIRRIPSCTMNHIGTDVAAAINKSAAHFAPVHSERTQSILKVLHDNSALQFVSMSKA